MLRERLALHVCMNGQDIGKTDILEYDADRIAANYMWQFISRALDYSDTSKTGIELQWSGFRSVAFAVDVLFRLFAQEAHPVANYDSVTHPHPEVRNILSQVVFRENAQNVSETVGIVQDGAFRRAMADIIDTWEVLELPNSPLYSFDKDLLDELCIDTIHRLDALQTTLSQLSHHKEVRRWSAQVGQYV